VPQFIKSNRIVGVLIVFAASLPIVIFGVSGYAGYPGGKPSWFSPFELPLMGISILCCCIVPLFVKGSLWRRFFLLMIAFGALAVAVLIGVIASMAVFGLPVS
jgi:hypothetical protein